jgi:hypothetical protein
MKNIDVWKRSLEQNAVLDPVDRTSEVLFGLIMVLSFTGAINVSTDGRQEIRELLWAALGCNVAWGLVDAIMYLMNVLFERGYSLNLMNKLRKNNDRQSSRSILREGIQPLVSNLLTEEEIDKLADRIKALPDPSIKYLLTKKDFYSAFQIFLLVFICTLPVALPFGIFSEPSIALQVSNAVAIVLLFVGGFILASYAGFRRSLTAFIYMLIGVILVAITIALGG